MLAARIQKESGCEIKGFFWSRQYQFLWNRSASMFEQFSTRGKIPLNLTD